MALGSALGGAGDAATGTAATAFCGRAAAAAGTPKMVPQFLQRMRLPARLSPRPKAVRQLGQAMRIMVCFRSAAAKRMGASGDSGALILTVTQLGGRCQHPARHFRSIEPGEVYGSGRSWNVN